MQQPPKHCVCLEEGRQFVQVGKWSKSCLKSIARFGSARVVRPAPDDDDPIDERQSRGSSRTNIHLALQGQELSSPGHSSAEELVCAAESLETRCNDVFAKRQIRAVVNEMPQVKAKACAVVSVVHASFWVCRRDVGAQPSSRAKRLGGDGSAQSAGTTSLQSRAIDDPARAGGYIDRITPPAQKRLE